MTKTELILFEKMIESAVKKAVDEAIDSHIKKELKEIKLLTAKIIKEARETRGTPLNESTMTTISRTSSDVNAFPRFAKTTTKAKVSPEPPMPKLPETIANQLDQSGNLPDVDAPIFFDPNSSMMQAFKDKLVNK